MRRKKLQTEKRKDDGLLRNSGYYILVGVLEESHFKTFCKSNYKLIGYKPSA